MGIFRSGKGMLARPLERLREAGWRILQTTVAAVASWYLALLLLPAELPFFAPIAAIIALGASYGERGRRTREVIVGVVFGIAIAELLVSTIGTGIFQLGLMLLMSMAAAVLVRGGPILVNQAAISALLLTVLEPPDAVFSTHRILEAVLGGGVALVVNSLLFPPNPMRMADRALGHLVRDLAHALEQTAAALASGDPDRAAAALGSARGVDDRVDAFDAALEVGGETARFAPPRRAALGPLAVYEREARQLDFAVRNTRVLARDVMRFVRRDALADAELADAVRGLADAVRALGEGDESERRERTHALVLEATGRAEAVLAQRHDPATSAIVSRIRSTAADLLRAAEPGGASSEASYMTPTDELLSEERDRPRD